MTLGSVALLAGVILAGVAGLPAGPLLGGLAATVFAWDAGGFAVDLAAQLGREAETDRLEARHCAGTAAVLLGSAGLGLGVYVTAGGGQPVVALLLLVVAAAVLLAAMDQP